MTEDEMVGRHRPLSQTPGDSEGQGSLACHSPWGCKELDTNEPVHFPVFWPGKSHGQRSLAGHSPWGCKELDMTEAHSRNQNEDYLSMVHLSQKKIRGNFQS